MEISFPLYCNILHRQLFLLGVYVRHLLVKELLYFFCLYVGLVQLHF